MFLSNGLTTVRNMWGSPTIDAFAAEYHLLHSARADLLRRIDSRQEAAHSYSRAFELARTIASVVTSSSLRQVQSSGPG
jgi:predicted RNA polymerase sigma factor